MSTQTPSWYPTPGDDGAGQSQQSQGAEINSGAWSAPDATSRPRLGKPVFLDGVPIAPAWKRCASLLIDLAAVFLVVRLVSVPAAFLAIVVLIVAGGYGHSVGKVATGIITVRPVRHPGGQTLARPGIARSFCRAFVHCFDTIAFLGLLVPFANSYRRMPADSLTHVIHIDVDASQRWQGLPAAPSPSVNAT